MASSGEPTDVRELLLARRGLVFVDSQGPALAEDAVLAVSLELAQLGYVPSSRLEQRLTRCTLDELVALREWMIAALRVHLGDREHVPLFRRFPHGVPSDTLALWWRKVLGYYVQAEDMPCLTCDRVGTTHVLSPCRHVVCDQCFDGSSYSACPICEHHVDRSSPFFLASPELATPNESPRLRRLELGDDVDRQAEALFVALCQRTQALSPDDRGALQLLVTEYRARVFEWLPASIPVRENVALVFGTLVRSLAPAEVLPIAARHMTTATDVLRFVAVLSGTDGSLQPETVHRVLPRASDAKPLRFWGRIAKLLAAKPATITVPIQVRRFKVAKLPRALRRMLLGLLERLDRERRIEDMLRHRSYWVWVGEFLHPHEYAARFPGVAEAFAIVRGKAPDGTPAPVFRTWYARVEQAAIARDARALVDVLAERPGELARRLDLALRLAGDDAAARDHAIATFVGKLPALANPVLLGLRSSLPTRDRPAARRVYWPKGKVGRGVSAPDHRPTLSRAAIDPLVTAIDRELLRRFGERPRFEVGLIDAALRDVIVPFNERTASRSAIALPRGSKLAIPEGKLLRLFLHWCQPEGPEHETDLDLSIAFYDEAWRYLGVCSYYQLQFGDPGSPIAQSAGDLRDAPWPDGASEFVDLHRAAALEHGIRYAVAVINAYAGLSFSRLARAFAGVMIRDDPEGQHFDPRTVALKFALEGDNGMFMPFAFDVRESTLHWLDVHAKGRLEMNNVATSNAAISKIAPELIDYFASGVRPSMYDLALLHAAARCDRVFVRGPAGFALYVRRADESVFDFHHRMVGERADEPRCAAPRAEGPPLFAALVHADLALPEASVSYSLTHEQAVPTLAASDLIS
ncbi:MXAN_6230/SCO0854 family RING domain-containing protein [Nannocystaceae bacterium ST9]